MKRKLFLAVLIVFVLGSFVVSNAAVTMNLDKESYTVGEEVTVTFADAEGNNNAWLAIYPSGDSVYQDYAEGEKVWLYANTGTETAGADAATTGSVTFSTEGLAVGTYRLSYFPNSGYDVGGTVTFEIAEEQSNPQTSDSFLLMPITFISIAAIFILKSKKAIQ